MDAHGRDRMSIDGIPCGNAIRVDVFEFVLDAVNRTLGLPPRRLGRPLLRPLRARGLDRSARAWTLHAVGHIGRRSIGQSAVAFISEGATPSALESSIAVAHEMTAAPPAIGASDPRSLRAWSATGLRAHPLGLTVREDLRVGRVFGPRATDAWRAVRKALPPLLVDGRDLTSIAVQAMEAFLPRSVSRLGADWMAIGQFLDACDAKEVVLASDQHRTGRLAAEYARQSGRRSTVLQHGLPQDRTGYLPLHADTFLAWSELASRWMQARGTASDRISVVGNPRLDRLVTGRARGAGSGGSASTANRGPARILLALSVAPVEVNARLVAMVVDASALIPDVLLDIKLHPGGSDWQFVRRTVRERGPVPGRVSILERESLYPLLERSDVVIVHRSSVAAEALAAHRPVIAVAADGTSVASVELPDLGLPEVDNSTHLAKLILELLNEEARSVFIARRYGAIVDAVGPIDGHNALRAAEAISAIASNVP